MESYEKLAISYDALTTDVAYERRADYLEKLFQKSKIPVHTVLDLACGTGTMTWILAQRGYEMIGVDSSEEMLAEATQKNYPVAIPPLFLQQTMQNLDLYGTVDAVICCLDSVNYLLKLNDVEKMMNRVHLFLSPGGIFLFDINSPEKLRGLDNQVFLDEKEDIYCIWRTEYQKRSQRVYYDVDLFTRDGKNTWKRSSEEHIQKLYEPDELCQLLKKVGYKNIHTYGDLSLKAPKEKEQRIYFSSIRK